MTGIGYLACLVVLIGVIQIVAAGLQLEIKLETYKNPGNRLADSETCCERDQSVCRASCYNTLILCVSSMANKGSCDLVNSMKVNQKEIYDDESFNEGADEPRFQNPFKVNLPADYKQGQVSISFRVFQSGTILAAQFDDIVVNMDSTLPWQSISVATEESRRYRRFKKELEFKTRTLCSADHIGKYCEIAICKPRDDDKGHYTCTSDNQKVCLPGWIDPSTNCLTKKVQPTSSTTIEPSTSIIEPSTSILQPMETTIYPTSSSQPITTFQTSVSTNEIQETSHVFTLASSSLNKKMMTKSTVSTTTRIQILKTSIYPTKSTTREQPRSTTILTSIPKTNPPKLTTKLPTTVKIETEPTIKTTQKKSTRNTFPTEEPITQILKTTERPVTKKPRITHTKRHTKLTTTVKINTETPITTQKLQTEEMESTKPRPSRKSGSQEIYEEREKARVDNTVLITVICLTLAMVAWVVVLVVIRKRVKSKNKIHSSMMQKSETYMIPASMESSGSSGSGTNENMVRNCSISLANQNFMETNLTEPII
ncbi:probable serine/threonine-protein kinase nek3 [Clytia hemisphaerica]|uniref:DSL domain-containing protein n=1 Tax=Clytia hemisphaerica TaxID=252671 RepID=A0A7M5TUM7_9CNID|eukprot:TCONS_00056429-protein